MTRPRLCQALGVCVGGWALLALAASASASSAQAVEASENPPPASLGDALRRGDVELGLRYRFEQVEDDAFAESAEASTLRTTLGFRSQPYRGWSVVLEAEDVSVLGDDQGYRNAGAGSLDNSLGAPSVLELPVVADPEITEIHQAYLRKQATVGGGGLDVTVGRLEIVVGDQRFVGPVGWRQNHQAFDALRVVWTGERAAVDAAHLDRVHRIFGDDRALSGQSLRVSTVLLDRGSWSLRAVPFGLWLDFDRGPGSSDTLGVELDGTVETSSWELGGDARWARQEPDVGGSTRYLQLGLSASRPVGDARPWTLGLVWERLGAGTDGGPAFSTPLATLHKWNGWADQFLQTPAAGLDTVYASLRGRLFEGRSLGGRAWDGLRVAVVALDFVSDEGGRDLGDELDLELVTTIPGGVTLLLKAADFRAARDSGRRDVLKLMLQAGYRI